MRFPMAARPARLLALAVVPLCTAGASADETHVYPDVTDAVFECVIRVSEAEHGTRYERSSLTHGTATTANALWSVTISYDFDPAAARLKYALVEKSWNVPAAAIWPGIASAVERCR